jgi:hypothetical protein
MADKLHECFLKKVISILVPVVFLMISGYAHVPAQESLSLWEKAVKIAAENAKWVPGFVIHFEEEYSRFGIRQELIETHSLLHENDSHEVEVNFLKIIDKGKDITEDFIAEYGATLVLEEGEYRLEHPFQETYNRNVQYQQTGKTKKINGTECVLFEFSYENEKGTWQGTAWLEQESGTPVILMGELVSVPLDEKWYTVTELKISAEYTTNHAGHWYPESAVVESNISVGDKFLKTYKGRIKETYRFQDYWELE